LPSQESFLELSKYLFSDAPYDFDDFADTSVVSQLFFQHAFDLISENIENKDLKKLTKGISPWNPVVKTISKEIYDWMQANYGKYKIKRAW